MEKNTNYRWFGRYWVSGHSFFSKNAKDSGINTNKMTYAGNLKALPSIKCNNGYAFERVDICNKEEVIRVFDEHKSNLVIHLTAESHVDRSLSSPNDFI